MGRPSKLTDAQWDEIRKRLLAGEKAADLSREYGVSKTRISERVSKRVENIKTVANQIVATEVSLRALPVSEQNDALSLADDLKSISKHLAGAGRYGAATAHRLSGIAHMKVAEIDDAAPLTEDSLSALKGIAVLTKMANESSEIGLNLLRANKEAVDRLNEPESDRETLLREIAERLPD
jgi:hypothetical protein